MLRAPLSFESEVIASDEIVDVEIEEFNEPLEDLAAETHFTPSSHTYQLHIVYSPNYRVPVLYFNGVDACTSRTAPYKGGNIDHHSNLETDALLSLTA